MDLLLRLSEERPLRDSGKAMKVIDELLAGTLEVTQLPAGGSEELPAGDSLLILGIRMVNDDYQAKRPIYPEVLRA